MINVRVFSHGEKRLPCGRCGRTVGHYAECGDSGKVYCCMECLLHEKDFDKDDERALRLTYLIRLAFGSIGKAAYRIPVSRITELLRYVWQTPKKVHITQDVIDYMTANTE